MEEKLNQTEERAADVIEDLTVDETKTDGVKGGHPYVVNHMLSRGDLKGE